MYSLVEVNYRKTEPNVEDYIKLDLQEMGCKESNCRIQHSTDLCGELCPSGNEPSRFLYSHLVKLSYNNNTNNIKL